MNVATTVNEALDLLAKDPEAAADRLEAAGHRLIALAKQLRERVEALKVFKPAGVGDFVKMQCIGPDGAVKHETVTA